MRQDHRRLDAAAGPAMHGDPAATPKGHLSLHVGGWKHENVEVGFMPAHSGDRERLIRSIVNTGSGDHEQPLGPA
jgi:hypothetical protein